jgi:hypothetical protein
VSFYIDPTASRDNSTETEDLAIRWDFNNDGEWDTDYVPLEGIWDHEPEPLPVGIWSVACEVKDQAGLASTAVDTLVLPDWVPVVPDVGLGIITVNSGGDPFVHADTLQAGESFRIHAWRTDWLHDYDTSIVQRLFVDDQLVEELSGSAGYPHLRTCFAVGGRFSDGVFDVGNHVVRVELEILDGPLDTDLSNNSATTSFFIEE